MKFSKIVKAALNRWETLRIYAAAGPSMIGLHRWLRVGSLACRLFGGPGRARPTNTGPRDLRLPIGPKRNQSVIVDIASFDELLALREVLVEKIYPLDR